MLSRYDLLDTYRDIGKTSDVRFLTVIRHCAAENTTPDYDRTLSSLGREQAGQLRAWACDPDALGAFGPTTCVVSAAARTRETYALGLAGTPFVRSLEFSELIYNGVRDVTAHDLVRVLHDIDPVSESLSVIAHNPSVMDLAFALVDQESVDTLNSFEVGTAMVFEIHRDRPLELGTNRLVATFHQERVSN
ncbi:MAG: hypothetical protein KJS64_07945 [Acidobacteria bacterium]|nr:hypothetical protein [Acidobacteriota bacterium]